MWIADWDPELDLRRIVFVVEYRTLRYDPFDRESFISSEQLYLSGSDDGAREWVSKNATDSHSHSEPCEFFILGEPMDAGGQPIISSRYDGDGKLIFDYKTGQEGTGEPLPFVEGKLAPSSWYKGLLKLLPDNERLQPKPPSLPKDGEETEDQSKPEK